jgi:segregation and condensation protein A
MDINIKLEAFEGPFDLLYHLIEKNQINIYDIPISELTDQYLEYINEINNTNLEITSEFLVMAATLIEIKSKMLLPKVKSEETEEE